MTAISSNHYSHDQQVQDALDYLQTNHLPQYEALVADFPEVTNIRYVGSWFDVEGMQVDPEWSSWVADAIETTGLVIWEEGEPWAVDWSASLPIYDWCEGEDARMERQ
jgi:hypothetical protein